MNKADLFTKSRVLLLSLLAVLVIALGGATLTFNKTEASAAEGIEVTNITDFTSGAIAFYIDFNNDTTNWDMFTLENPFAGTTNNDVIHPKFTVDGYRNVNNSHYYHEDLGVYTLDVSMYGGPVFSMPSGTVVILAFLYKDGASVTLQEDTIVEVDGPIANFLGETFSGNIYTAQYVTIDGTAKFVKVNAVTFTAPTKTVYAVGDTLDMTGAKFNVDYVDVADREIAYEDSLKMVDVTGFDSTTPGEKVATVNYHGKTFTFNYTVEAPVTDVYASGIAYTADANWHYLTLAYEGVIADGDITSTVADSFVLNNNGESVAVSSIEGALVIVANGGISVCLPKTYALKGNAGIKLAEDVVVGESTVKPFEYAITSTVISTKAGVAYAADATQHLIIFGLTGDAVKTGFDDLTAVKPFIKIGDKKLSEIEGATAYTHDRTFLCLTVPTTAFASLEGMEITIEDGATLPSLDALAGAGFRVIGGKIYKEATLSMDIFPNNYTLMFMKVDLGTTDYATYSIGLGTENLNFVTNIAINGAHGKYSFDEYAGVETWFDTQVNGSANLGGLVGVTEVGVWAFLYGTNKEGAKNIPEGTILTVNKNFVIADQFVLDRDYSFEFINNSWVEISSAELKTAPTKTDYFVSDEYDIAGAQVQINYADGTSKVVDLTNETKNTVVAEFDSITAGENKTAYITYRGLTVAFNYNVEQVAGELRVAGLTYSSTADNYVITLTLNDEYVNADVDAILEFLTINGVAVSDYAGATATVDGTEANAKLVVVIPKTALTLTGAFTVALAQDYQINEFTKIIAFANTYETAIVTVTSGTATANEEVYTLTFNLSGDPIANAYGDFTALANATIVNGTKFAEINGANVVANGNALVFTIPVSAFATVEDVKVVFGENAYLPSLNTLASGNFVVRGEKIYAVATATMGYIDAFPHLLFIKVNVGTDAYASYFEYDTLSTKNENFNNNVIINSVAGNLYSFEEYPNVQTHFDYQINGKANLGDFVASDEVGIWGFLLGTNNEGNKDIPVGSILTIKKNLVLLNNTYTLDRDYVFQLVKTADVIEWKEVSSIAMTSNPTIEFYAVGETVDMTGAVVTVTYKDNTTEAFELNAGYANVKFEGFDSSEAGEKQGTVNFYGYTFGFDYSVKEITGYSIETQPTKTSYKVGEVINLAGMTVKVAFGDAYRTVNFDADAMPEGFTVEGFTSENATDSLVVTVKHGEATVGTLTFVVNPPVVESIEVTAPNKVSYFVGDELDLTGGTFVAYYDIGRYGEETALTAEGVTVTGFDGTVAGTQTITVTFANCTDTFEVTVVAIAVTFAEGVAPTSATYTIGGELAVEGGSFKVYFNNGTEEEVAFTDERVEFSFDRNTSEQTVEVTATFEGYTYVFTANVVEEPAPKGCFASVASVTPVYFVLCLIGCLFIVRRKLSENK